jgi:transcriptional regulator with XRE-family HTH domain
MTEIPVATAGPEWDTADRMRKALREAGIGVQEMADHLGVARNTVSSWINGRIEPDKRTLLLWASYTGVPYEWLTNETGPNGRGGMRGRSGRGFRTAPFRMFRTPRCA